MFTKKRERRAKKIKLHFTELREFGFSLIGGLSCVLVNLVKWCVRGFASVVGLPTIRTLCAWFTYIVKLVEYNFLFSKKNNILLTFFLFLCCVCLTNSKHFGKI